MGGGGTISDSILGGTRHFFLTLQNFKNIGGLEGSTYLPDPSSLLRNPEIVCDNLRKEAPCSFSCVFLWKKLKNKIIFSSKFTSFCGIGVTQELLPTCRKLINLFHIQNTEEGWDCSKKVYHLYNFIKCEELLMR